MVTFSLSPSHSLSYTRTCKHTSAFETLRIGVNAIEIERIPKVIGNCRRWWVELKRQQPFLKNCTLLEMFKILPLKKMERCQSNAVESFSSSSLNAILPLSPSHKIKNLDIFHNTLKRPQREAWVQEKEGRWISKQAQPCWFAYHPSAWFLQFKIK